MHFSARPTIRLQTCKRQWSILIVARESVLVVSGTHIFDLSMGSGRLELKENDVEDRHREGGTMIGKSFKYSLVATCILSNVQYLYNFVSGSRMATGCSYVSG